MSYKVNYCHRLVLQQSLPVVSQNFDCNQIGCFCNSILVTSGDTARYRSWLSIPCGAKHVRAMCPMTITILIPTDSRLWSFGSTQCFREHIRKSPKSGSPFGTSAELWLKYMKYRYCDGKLPHMLSIDTCREWKIYHFNRKIQWVWRQTLTGI